MAPAYTVAAHFHVRADAIDVMKQVIDEVTKPSLSEEGCQIYHWSQGAEDPALFLLTWSGATKPPSTHMLPRRTYRGPNNDERATAY
jgi:Antibiotic biosynthesis monooxygenase